MLEIAVPELAVLRVRLDAINATCGVIPVVSVLLRTTVPMCRRKICFRLCGGGRAPGENVVGHLEVVGGEYAHVGRTLGVDVSD